MVGIGWFYCAVSGRWLCGEFRHDAIRRRVVPDIEQAVMDAAQLVVRPGVDCALRDDGRCRMAGVAGRQFRNGAVPVFRAIAVERGLVIFILRRAVAAVGPHQYRSDEVGHCDHDFCIRHAFAARSFFDGALYLLGKFGDGFERFDLHVELSQLAFCGSIR